MSPTNTMAMAMPTSTETASSTVDGMGGMSSSAMAMTFFLSDSTTLFFKGWTPSSAGAYVATCLFLVALAVILRTMLALKPVLEDSVWKAVHPSEMLLPEEDELVKREPGRDPNRAWEKKSLWRVTAELRSRWSGWNFSTSCSRALFEAMLAITGYFLMLAVMTYNVGYFLSVAVGVFLGTFLLGDLATTSSLYQDNHC